MEQDQNFAMFLSSLHGGTRDDVFDELQVLLVSMGEECDVLTLVDQPD
jgi:hypothetical protein